MSRLIPFLQRARIVKEQNQKSYLFWKNNQQLKTIKELYMKVKYHKLYKSLKKVLYYYYYINRYIIIFVCHLYLVIGKKQQKYKKKI